VTAVFSHGRLRLYLLKLLAEGPKHGYELIRLLEDRFLGLYAPSAGTIYPRLQRMEAEGLVTHTAAGGRKTYEITAAGEAELAERADELAALETDIHASVRDLAGLAMEIQDEVRGSVRDVKRELREAARQARRRWEPPSPWRSQQPTPVPELPPESVAGVTLERRAAELAGEVRRLVRRQGVPQDVVRTATDVVEVALAEVRRLLRG
jgi:DNA-binding PadR family transcriptional regulator